jgi:hypothetical protein
MGKGEMSTKPLIHWIIYKQYTVHFTRRGSQTVEGILRTPRGEVPFHYDLEARTIHLPTGTVSINPHGWELSQVAGQANPTDSAQGGKPT